MYTLDSEIETIITISEHAFASVINKFETYSEGQLSVSDEAAHVLRQEHNLLRRTFIAALQRSRDVAQLFEKGRADTRRLPHYNSRLQGKLSRAKINYPQAAELWVLGGLLFKNQIAGIKRVAYLPDGENEIIDVLNSAASLSLGAENPWAILADRYEDHYGIRDNMCSAYHLGLRQGFAMEYFSGLYPSKEVVDEIVVQFDSSGAVAASIAIESAVAYAEKHLHLTSVALVAAVDGTWAGGFGSAREATGFGVDKHQLKRTGGALWADRCLPPPTAENRVAFLSILRQKIENKTLAGVYLEPDIIGDLGIISTDETLLKEAIALLKSHGIPIIIDCVQQIGRSGSYWGDKVDKYFKNYPSLIAITAKSASNGLPFSMIMMPRVIAESAHPLTQASSNHMNGPLLRAAVVAETLSDATLQEWIGQKTEELETIAQSYGFEISDAGLRGAYMNRGIHMQSNEMVMLTQLALYVEDGILIGALPYSLRYQPMLLELSETNRLLAHAIFKRVIEVGKGNISPATQEMYKLLSTQSSGLAR